MIEQDSDADLEEDPDNQDDVGEKKDHDARGGGGGGGPPPPPPPPPNSHPIPAARCTWPRVAHGLITCACRLHVAPQIIMLRLGGTEAQDSAARISISVRGEQKGRASQSDSSEAPLRATGAAVGRLACTQRAPRCTVQRPRKCKAPLRVGRFEGRAGDGLGSERGYKRNDKRWERSKAGGSRGSRYRLRGRCKGRGSWLGFEAT